MVMTLPWPSTIRVRRAGLYSMVITSPGRNTRVVALCDSSRALSASSGVSVFPTNDITADESPLRPVEAASSAAGRWPVSADCPHVPDVHRSDDRRVGAERVSTLQSRQHTNHYQTTTPP